MNKSNHLGLVYRKALSRYIGLMVVALVILLLQQAKHLDSIKLAAAISD
ncbi:hypothetical protein [Xenorhabdus beddingii]|nr:hypothetical protein [Xenorhabdus beddingii]